MIAQSQESQLQQVLRPGSEDKYDALKLRVHRRIISELDPVEVQGQDSGHLRRVVEEAAQVLLNADPEASSLTRAQRAALVEEVVDGVLGLGPIQSLLDDPTVSEVMVNGPKEIYVERYGRLERTDKKFRDDAHVMQVVERIISPVGRRLDESSPMVDARVPGGYRLNAVIPPLSLQGPVVTIRKFFDERFGMEDLVKIGSITAEAANFLAACVKAKMNIIVSGGTGSGKTTFMNALSAFIPNEERIITIENPAELRLKQEHVVRLETRPPSIDGRNEVTQRDLVVNALRMRPNRIIVGEVRAGEAFDMLQAMNTGHEGSISTVHANSPRDALTRIENMVLMAGFDLPTKVIREQMASALHLIVHMERFADGSRKVTKLTEVAGLEGQTITIQDIYSFRHQGVDREGRVQGLLAPTGIRPTFSDRFEERGVSLDTELFMVAS